MFRIFYDKTFKLDAAVCISYFFEDAYFQVFDIVSCRIKMSCHGFVGAAGSYVALVFC